MRPAVRGTATVKVSERRNNRGRKEATVIRVLGRAGKELTGELVQRGKAFFVQPTSKKYPEIAVDKHDLGEAAVGDCVAVSISHYGDEQFMPQGVVRADLGESGTMEAAIAAVLHENGVYDVFPNEVLEQALAIPQEVDMGTAGKRLDLRDKLIFTIDGDDAKDFDDAVSLEKLENGHYLLGVHIADVSHYVTPDSPLDAEAFRRGPARVRRAQCGACTARAPDCSSSRQSRPEKRIPRAAPCPPRGFC